ncbi:hypothetical protein B0A50_01421 [Salinomyces thailandicus]|uniref:Uncharacterized protein n=1 Tax=Salinomyces thailandicus TaxID=706561 RepID=A0A4U0U9Z1_9PEZI|nr:hypothetical protein B0A50_01421 [Salinomyces thailandica]
MYPALFWPEHLVPRGYTFVESTRGKKRAKVDSRPLQPRDVSSNLLAAVKRLSSETIDRPTLAHQKMANAYTLRIKRSGGPERLMTQDVDSARLALMQQISIRGMDAGKAIVSSIESPSARERSLDRNDNGPREQAQPGKSLAAASVQNTTLCSDAAQQPPQSKTPAAPAQASPQVAEQRPVQAPPSPASSPELDSTLVVRTPSLARADVGLKWSATFSKDSQSLSSSFGSTQLENMYSFMAKQAMALDKNMTVSFALTA